MREDLKRVIPSVMYRMTFELLICPNEDWLKNVGKATMNVMICLSTCLSLIPRS